MGEVVAFTKKTGKYDLKIRETFHDINKKIKYARNVCNSISTDSIDELNYLDGYISYIIIKGSIKASARALVIGEYN